MTDQGTKRTVQFQLSVYSAFGVVTGWWYHLANMPFM
jgi:hypothetical protein